MSANDLLFKIQILIGLYLFQHPENMHDIVASTIMLPNKNHIKFQFYPIIQQTVSQNTYTRNLLINHEHTKGLEISI